MRIAEYDADADSYNADGVVTSLRRAVSLATAFLVVGNDMSVWGKPSQDILQAAASIRRRDSGTTTMNTLFRKLDDSMRRQSFGNNIRRWHRTKLQLSWMRLTRGLMLLWETSNTTTTTTLANDGCADIARALEDAEQVFAELTTASSSIEAVEAQVACFQIMTAAFCVLRPAPSAVTSIVTQLQALLHGDANDDDTGTNNINSNSKKKGPIRSALDALGQCLQESSSGTEKEHCGDDDTTPPPPALWREEKALLDLVLSRVCAAAALCEALGGLDQVRCVCQARLPSQIQSWPTSPSQHQVCVYKMARAENLALVAVPAAALAVVADPWVAMAAAATAVWGTQTARFHTTTTVRHGSRLLSLTKPLSDFDAPPRNNFYVWRYVLANLMVDGRSLWFVPPHEELEQQQQQQQDNETNRECDNTIKYDHNAKEDDKNKPIKQSEKKENDNNHSEDSDSEHEIVFVEAEDEITEVP